jgi:diaminohydroxyphosphoribosylaminopyrimidine deaminase/5-amino-6-(5-phosphoribosylamino)uracil reductase
LESWVATSNNPADAVHMRTALTLARRGLGRVWPNPAVGCVLVEAGTAQRVVGRGWTQKGGRPHAETEALRRAGDAARGATAYVSLEPCSHHGLTPPCADALIAAGVARVVIAAEDPDPRVSGQGIDRLRKAGIGVEVGLLDAEAKEVNAGFLKRLADGRPLMTLKAATSLDGRIGTSEGQSKWITGDVSRTFGHRLRAENDAVLTGIGTVLADDPQMTCRLPGMAERSPVRIVLDSKLRIPVESFLVQSADSVPTWVVTSAKSQQAEVLRQRGVTVIEAEVDGEGRPDLRWLAAELGRRGLTRVLIEAGAQLSGAWMRAGLVDRIAWFRASKMIGGDGIPVTDGIGIATLKDAPSFVRMSLGEAGSDVVELYRRPD